MRESSSCVCQTGGCSAPAGGWTIGRSDRFRRIWMRRAATSASSSFRTKYTSVVRMSLWPANSRTSCKAQSQCTSSERLSRLGRSAYNRRCGAAGIGPVVPATL
jgi:hypothetical protein